MQTQREERERREWTCRRCYRTVELLGDGLDDDRIRDHQDVECAGETVYEDLMRPYGY